MTQHSRLRRYDPKPRGFEWEEMPEDKEGALALLEGPPGAEETTVVYWGWRGPRGERRGVSPIRAGDAARERDGGNSPVARRERGCR